MSRAPSIISLSLVVAIIGVGWLLTGASRAVPPRASVPRIEEDFEPTGDGSHASWSAAEWVPLQRRGEGLEYDARFKALWSSRGIYFLFDGTDARVTATMTEDFDDLWNEDVFEVFLWPDERWPVYLEYEISPLGKELPILVPNFEGSFLGWRPWHYEGERVIRKAVSARGGELLPGADVSGWTAEIFIPWDLFRPLRQVPPRPGATWRANVYRMDYDEGRKTAWEWAPVGPSFHEFEKFGTLTFE